MVFGIHTHTAPGAFYGNALYDAVVGRKPQTVDANNGSMMLEAIVSAVTAAWNTRVPARVGFEDRVVAGLGRNRSVPAARAIDVDPDPAWLDPAAPWKLLNSPDTEAGRCDPRVRTLAAWTTDGPPRLIGLLGTVACHNTLVPFAGTRYDADWVGAAARLASTHTGAAEADLDADARAARITTFAGKLAGAVTSPLPPPQHEVTVNVRHHGWRPLATPPAWLAGLPSIVDWDIGAPMLGGAEDHRSGVTFKYAFEGATVAPYDSPQSPKVKALPILRQLAKTLGLRPSREHAPHAVIVSGTLIVTVPGEPTVATAWLLERTLGAHAKAQRTWVLGYTGDYAGYFTTPREYDRQHYEAASTLYGRDSVAHLAELYRRVLDRPRAAVELALVDWSAVLAPHLDGVLPPNATWVDDDVVVSWWASRAPEAVAVRRGAAAVDRAVTLSQLAVDEGGKALFVATITTEPGDAAGFTVDAYGDLLVVVPARE